MKITISQLRKIIKEEVSLALNEGMSFDDLMQDEFFNNQIKVEKNSVNVLNSSRAAGKLPPFTDDVAVSMMSNGLSLTIKNMLGRDLTPEEKEIFQEKLLTAFKDPTISMSSTRNLSTGKSSYQEPEVDPRARALSRAAALGRKWTPSGRRYRY